MLVTKIDATKTFSRLPTMKCLSVMACIGIACTTLAQPKKLADRIAQVENNLIPFVPVKHFKGWNIIDRMQYYKVPGVSIAVIKDFKIDWAKAYGVADTISRQPVTTSTMFSAGSISKLVMAAAALQMVEAGKIDLDKPINNYLTSWKLGENNYTKHTPVTLAMLLSHSAGTTQSAYFGFTPGKMLPGIVDILSGAKIAESRPVVVNSEPNKAFRYSGGGSMVAQLALMDVAKQSFADLTQQIIFNKLGMRHSTFEQPLPPKFAAQSAWAYSGASWFKGMPYVYPQQAAAGLYSTPTDLAKFFIDLQLSYTGRGKLLSQSMATKMFTPKQLVSDGAYKEQIGLGPFLIQRTDNTGDDGMYFEFTGVNAGFLAYGIASKTGGNGAVIMLNSGDDVNGLGKEIRRAIAQTYQWKNFLPEPVIPAKLSPAALEAYTGRYRMGPNEVLYLRRENDYLVENINEGTDIYCFPVAADSIVFTDYNIKGGFSRNDRGEVTGLQNIYQQQPMLKMKADEFSPNEYLQRKQYDKAAQAFGNMKMNEYQITYLAYELLNKKPYDDSATTTILNLALQQHPNSSIVYSRWGDYYSKMNDKAAAIKSYTKAAALDPSDEQVRETLKALQ